MKTTFKQLTIGAMLAVAGLAANAASFDLTGGPYASTSNKFNNNNFNDIYNFSFQGDAGIASGSSIEYKLGSYIDIDWADTNAFVVYGGLDGTGPVLASFNDPGTAAGSFSFTDLNVPTQFSVALSGHAIGNGNSLFQPGLKGSYNLSVVAQPVPEPETYALMLAGLGAVGYIVRRRKQQ
jgi:PEP-CTERM motif-containing protein